jgi:hypothetical protein
MYSEYHSTNYDNTRDRYDSIRSGLYKTGMDHLGYDGHGSDIFTGRFLSDAKNDNRSFIISKIHEASVTNVTPQELDALNNAVLEMRYFVDISDDGTLNYRLAGEYQLNKGGGIIKLYEPE